LRHYRHCDHLIGNTKALCRRFREAGWPEERVHYLPNFVTPAASPRAIDRADLGVPATAPLAIALGRLHRNKGFDTLLEALAAAPALHLWLAGEGPERQALERQAKALGLLPRLRFLGWREDAAALIAAADLLVCSSRSEPLGNVVIEAWAAGVPVVAAASEGPAELIEDNFSGLLVPVDDAPALAAAMARLAADAALRARLAAGGKAAYESAFTEARVVAAYRDLFARLAA
jgi:glycosyltransferase involved in cell wall biosynthesis